jgi:EmrB/QacA subfamily drug resistance transporter
MHGDDLQWLVTAYLLMSGGGLLLGGRIADLLPRRRMFLIGLATFTLGSLMSALAGTAGTLIAARAGQGLGAAIMTPAALSIIMTTYEGAQRAKGLALWGAVGSVGIAAGVLAGGALTTWGGWQLIFWINVPLGVIAFAAVCLLVPAGTTTSTTLRQFDVPGAVAVVGGLAALLLAIQGAGTHGWASAYTISLLGIALVLFVGFRFIEQRAERPLVAPHTWRITSLVAGTGIMLAVTGVLVGAIFLTSIFLQSVLGYSPLKTGAAFLPLAVIMTVAAHAAGQMLRHLAPRTVAASGFAITAAGALLLATASKTSQYATGLLPGLLMLGLGAGLVFVAVSVSAMSGIPGQHAGMASGFLMTGHEVGAALGVAVVSAVAATAGSLTTSAAAQGFSRGLLAAAVVAGAAALAAIATMPKVRGEVTGGMHMH